MSIQTVLILIFLAIVIFPISIYLAARLGASAFYKSKREFMHNFWTKFKRETGE